MLSVMNKLEALQNIVRQADAGDLIFPTNVRATLKIQEALDAPDCGIESAARLLLQEPLITTRIIAIANSVAYSRFGGGITNVRTAITILGFSTLRSVVAAIVMRQLMQAVTTPAIVAKMEALWEHSAHVAAMTHLLARKVSKIDPETALFAGIVHEVGCFYLLSRAEEFPSLLEPHLPVSDNPLEEPLEIVIGRAVLHKLMVPKRVISAIETLWYGMQMIPPESLGDTLLLANSLTTPASPLDLRSAAEIAETAGKLDFPLETGTLRQLLDESDDDLQSLANALIH